MHFPSKKDWWLGWIMWIAVLLPPVMLIKEGAYVQFLICIPITLFVGWIWFGTGYTITEKEIKIRSGPLRVNIPIGDIKKIRGTRNPLASPALSLDRLEIKYRKYSTALISPNDKEGFVRAIKERNQDVEIEI